MLSALAAAGALLALTKPLWPRTLEERETLPPQKQAGRRETDMEILFNICIGLSAGFALGLVGYALRKALRGDAPYTEKQIAASQRLWRIGSRVLACITGLLLVAGFVWCCYFLILAAADPAQAEYAGNMAQLITAVLTVISIMFAFYEFLRRK